MVADTSQSASTGRYNPKASGVITWHDAIPSFLDGSNTPRAYLERCLETIDAREPTVRAFVSIDIEVARKAAIGRREREPGAERRLPEIVEDLDAAAARNFIRAFSTYFQVVNTAELVHRIRRRRDYLKDSKSVQPGSLVETLSRLKDAGVDAGAAADDAGAAADDAGATRAATIDTVPNVFTSNQDISAEAASSKPAAACATRFT